MAQAFQVETTIPRPAADVWAVLTDWDRAPEWMDGVEQLHADGPLAVGTTLRFTARGRDRPASLAAIDHARTLVIRSVQGGVTADYRYDLEPTPDGTQVRLTADLTTRGLLWRLAAPVLSAAMRRADSGQLGALRLLVEQPSRSEEA